MIDCRRAERLFRRRRGFERREAVTSRARRLPASSFSLPDQPAIDADEIDQRNGDVLCDERIVRSQIAGNDPGQRANGEPDESIAAASSEFQRPWGRPALPGEAQEPALAPVREAGPAACRRRARAADSSPHFATWADRLITCRLGIPQKI